jgi:nifR3 family TIM-barrel protein
MEDITDSTFRVICKRFGVDVLITEFISAEGLVRDAWKSRMKMHFEEQEHPIGIQIFGSGIDSMVKAAQVAECANPDFIDLNFGCPVRKVVMKGGGAALLQDIPKMIAMTRAVVQSTRLPVTVKTRLGWDEQHKDIVEIAERLQDAGITAISIHARTRTQLYGGTADWSLIGAVRNNPRMKIPVFGNGDINSGSMALDMKNRFGVDGLLIGRAAIGNPWLFREIRTFLESGDRTQLPTLSERVAIVKEHIDRSISFKGERIALLEMRKFYNGYFRGVASFKPFRMNLVTSGTWKEIRSILTSIESINAP